MLKSEGEQKAYYQAIPSMIVWELWKRNNSRKHEVRTISIQKVIFNVTRNIEILLKVRNPKQEFSYAWQEIVKELEKRRSKLKITKVWRKFPEERWVKYNTDGASRGNPCISSYACCLRNEQGDLIYAQGAIIADTTNVEAETIAILKEATHCSHSGYNKVVIQTGSLFVQKI